MSVETPRAVPAIPSIQQPLLVLHAVWLPATDETQLGSLLLWAESGRLPIRRDAGQGTRRLHPFTASPAELLRRLPGLKNALASGRRLVVPSQPDSPVASHELLRAALGQSKGAAAFVMARAYDAIDAEKYEEARQLLLKAVEADPLNDAAVNLYEKIKDIVEANGR